LKAFDRMIARFCYKHPRFGVKNLMLIIVIGNIAVWLLGMMDTTGTLAYYLMFSPELILKGQVWRLVTFVFMPPSQSPFTLLISLYFYYFIGKSLENQWGQARFTIYYLGGVLLSVIYGFVIYAFGVPAELIISAYYINMSMFLAFATLWPDATVLLFFIIPIKMKWLALIDVALFVVTMVNNQTLFPMIAILNYVIFCGDALISRMRMGRRCAARTIDFKAKARAAAHEERTRPYRHKCSVCGRTDADYPNLEFRYCSRCEGYHCFCEEHINNHIHFTE